MSGPSGQVPHEQKGAARRPGRTAPRPARSRTFCPTGRAGPSPSFIAGRPTPAVPRADATARFLKIPQPDLEREVALRYEEGLIALQKRMHPEAADRPVPEGVIIHGPPIASSRAGEGESPAELADHGRKIAQAMFESVRREICEDRAQHPGAFARPTSAVLRLVGHVSRATPPDELFVAAACLLWRQGLEKFCTEGEGGSA